MHALMLMLVLHAPPQSPKPAQAPSQLSQGPTLLEFAETSNLNLPKGAVRFEGTRWTQSLDQLSRDGGRTFERRTMRVPRKDLEIKWSVPGGMEGLEIGSWKVEKHRSVSGQVKYWIGDIGVKNSFGHTQQEHGILRSYPDGTRFDEVLRNARDEVFEHRVAVKENGKWKRYVETSVASARPPRYKGLEQSCASCHNEAGTGKYGVGLVPGGDTVISDPLDWTLAGHAAEVRFVVTDKPQEKAEIKQETILPYAEARKKALADGKMLVMFVNQPAFQVPGVIVTRHDGYDKDLYGVVIAVIKKFDGKEDLYEHEVIYGEVSRETILEQCRMWPGKGKLPEVPKQSKPQGQAFAIPQRQFAPTQFRQPTFRSSGGC